MQLTALVVAALVGLAAVPAQAQTPDFSGTWQLDRGRYHLSHEMRYNVAL